jgi:hypothetical protein
MAARTAWSLLYYRHYYTANGGNMRYALLPAKTPLPFDGKDSGIIQKLFWGLFALTPGIVLFAKVIVISGQYWEGF